MSALLTHLHQRRSTPFPLMGEEAPSENELQEMITVASRVPDHGKLAPWRFISIKKPQGSAIGAKLAEFIGGDDEARLKQERGRFTRAPLCIALVSKAAPHPKIPEIEQTLSAGAAGMNLIHAANALGYGAVWVTEWLAYDDRVKTLFGLQANERIAGFIHIGKAHGKADDRPRPVLSDILSEFKGV